jgi:drug/metabolite transporter (DMT)-like permease
MIKPILKNGVFICFVASFFLAVMGVGVRISSKSYNVDGSVSVLGRFIIGVILCLITIKYMKVSVLGQRKPLLILRGVLASAAAIFSFIAMSIPSFGLAKAVTLTYSSPVWALMFAWIFLKEKIRLLDILLLIMTFCGVALVLEVNFRGFGLGKAELAGLASAFFGGAAISTIKPLRRTESVPTIYLYYCMIGVLFSPFFIPRPIQEISPWAIPIIIFVGIFAFLGQMFLVYGMKYCRLVDANITLLATPVFSALMAFLIFNERLSYTFWTGCVLVLVSGVLTAYFQHVQQTQQKEADKENYSLGK